MQWFELVGFEGLYEISDTNEVRNCRTFRTINANSNARYLSKSGAAIRVRNSELKKGNISKASDILNKKLDEKNKQKQTFTWGNPNELSIMTGDAGEHLVCFELLTRNIRATCNVMSNASYDILADFGDGLIFTIQVKTTNYVNNNNNTEAYNFTNIGKSKKSCDIVALVALDIKKVVFLTYDKITACGHKSVQKTIFISLADTSIDLELESLYARIKP